MNKLDNIIIKIRMIYENTRLVTPDDPFLSVYMKIRTGF